MENSEGATGYKVMVVDFGIEEGWKSDKVMVHKFDAKTTKATIDDLYPTSTFCFKILAFQRRRRRSRKQGRGLRHGCGKIVDLTIGVLFSKRIQLINKYWIFIQINLTHIIKQLTYNTTQKK